MRKYISVLLIFTLILSSAAPSFAITRGDLGEIVKEIDAEKIKEGIKEVVEIGQIIIDKIKDIADHWAKEYIEKLISSGGINGYPDGTFKPDNTIKVGEFTKILISSLGYNGIENYTDGHWSLNFVDKAKELGIILEGEFKDSDLDRNIIRAEMARMIVRALDEEYPSNLEEYKTLIKDYNNIPEEFKDYVLKAYSKGIITGYPDGTFKYDTSATRAEASTMIVRLLDESERKVPKLSSNNEVEKNKYVKETLYTDKIVATDDWSKETVTLVPPTKESIETFNKVINIIAENEKGNYQIGIHENYGVGIGVLDEDGILKYEIQIKNKPNGRGDIYSSILKDFSDETVKKYKEILRVIFPTEHENVLKLMKNLYDTKNHKNYNNSYQADGRVYYANYSEVTDRVNIFIGEKVE